MSKIGRKRVVVALGSGKGGVGKTTLALALSERLCAQGHTVTLVDADLGGQNLTAALMHPAGGPAREGPLLNTVAVPRRGMAGGQLQLVSVCQTPSDAYEDDGLAGRLARTLRKLNSGLVIVDLGPGIAPFTLDCFLAADLGVVVTTPEPLAVRGSFRFLEACLLRGLEREAHGRPEAERLWRFLRKRRGNEDKPLRDLLGGFNSGRHCLTSLLENLLRKVRVGIVVNCVRDEGDKRVAQTLRAMVLDLLGMHTELWGYVPFLRELRRLSRARHGDGTWTTQLFDGSLDPLSSVVELAGRGLRRGWPSARITVVDGQNGPQVVCSTRCTCWSSCDLRRGGYPCRITPLGELKTLLADLAAE
ncbi:MAG: AAA family ATPase [Calditrichaeota bacterium]|nr:AAA family ATPase [Calditrichota bacterium]